MHYPVKPWRFVMLQDYPDAGLLKGDIVTATAGRKTRVIRVLPVNPGLLLNLDMLGIAAPIDAVIGTEAEIVAAMERADDKPPTETKSLKVVR